MEAKKHMADKIEKRDAVYLANIPELFGGKGWHGKGIVTAEFNAATLANVLWEHSYAPAGILLPDGSFHPTGQRYAVSGDDNKPLGNAVGTVFDTPTNKELFELFERAIAGSSEWEIVSCGTVEDRVQFFIDARKKDTTKAAGRDVATYFGLHRGFGGKTSVLFNGHSTVIQCANTTALFVHETMKAEGFNRVKNTSGILDRLPEIEQAIAMQIGVAGEFAKAMEAAAKVKVDNDTARLAYLGAIGRGELTTRTANRVNRLLELFRGNEGTKTNGGENAADFVNGFTEYFTHESATSDNPDLSDAKRQERREKQWYSSEFGSGRNIKADFVGKLFVKGKFAREQFGKLRETGEKILAETKDKDLLAILN